MPELSQDQKKLRKLMSDIIVLLCQQNLRYNDEIQVQGLVAVTYDKCNTLVIQLDVKTSQNKDSVGDVIELKPVIDLTHEEEGESRAISSRNLLASLVSAPRQLCRTQLPSSNCASDTMMVTEDDKDGIVVNASDSGFTNGGGTLENRTLCRTGGTCQTNTAVSRKVPPSVPVSSNCLNLCVVETHTCPTSRDVNVDQRDSVKSESVSDVEPQSLCLMRKGTSQTDHVTAASVGLNCSSRDSSILSSTEQSLAGNHQRESDLFSACAEKGIRKSTCGSAISNRMNQVRSKELSSIFSVNSTHSSLSFSETRASRDRIVGDQQISPQTDSVSSVEPPSLGLSPMDLSLASILTSQTQSSAAVSVGLNYSSSRPFTQSSAQTGSNQKQNKLLMKPLLDADNWKDKPHPLAIRTGRTSENSAAQNWNNLSKLSRPNNSTCSEVYTDIAEDRSSNDSRQQLVSNERDEMQDSCQLFRPFECKFPGCVGSYVDGSQLANHYSITHTESLGLCRLEYANPVSGDGSEGSRLESKGVPSERAGKSASESVRNCTVKKGFSCPYKNCKYVARVFSAVSNHHKRVHSGPIPRKIHEQMIWNNQNRECCSPWVSPKWSDAQTDVGKLKNLPSDGRESEDEHGSFSKKPLYGCPLSVGGGCPWTTSNWDQVVNHLHASHGMTADSNKSLAHQTG